MKENLPQQGLLSLLLLFLFTALSSPAQRAARDEAAEAKTIEPKSEAVDKSDPVEKSVVKIYATVRYPDYFKPWTKLSASSLVGSGVVIDGKRILSNAHLLLYANQVQVEGNDADDKVSATVEYISPEIDLAILKLDDDSFFSAHPPLARDASLPANKDPVTVYGFPTGGSSLSITRGIVSRTEFVKYNYSCAGLRIQVDAAINPGNSGGPVVINDKMVGLAFAHLSRAENISYIIPNEEIDLFLKAFEKGVAYHGRLGWANWMIGLENPALRSFLHLDKSVEGVAVQNVASLPPGNPFQKWDVLTHIGNTQIDNEMMVHLDNGLRVVFAYLINQYAKNGKVPVTVIRDGKTLQLEVPVSDGYTPVLFNLKGSFPSYFIYGPLVFCDATQDYVMSLLSGRTGGAWTGILLDRQSPLLSRSGGLPAYEGERLVVVSSVLPHKLSRGYVDPMAEVVKSVNGVAIKNLAQLVATLRDCKDDFVRFDFDDRQTETLVYPRRAMVAATDDILNDNSARNQGSSDMMAIWNQQ